MMLMLMLRTTDVSPAIEPCLSASLSRSLSHTLSRTLATHCQQRFATLPLWSCGASIKLLTEQH